MNHKSREIAAHFLVITAISLFMTLTFWHLDYVWNWSVVWQYRQKFYQGFVTTIALSLVSLALSTVTGLVVAMAREYGGLLSRATARIYLEVVRGTPLLVQILIFFYVIASFLGLENRFVAGALSLSFFAGAYMSEIIRSGLGSVGKSQLDSAKAIGLTHAQTLRYVVFPQAFRVILPPMSGQFASLIKDSSLLSVIAISELTLNAQEVNSFTYSALESYLPLAVLYLALTLPLSLLARYLESRFAYET